MITKAALPLLLLLLSSHGIAAESCRPEKGCPKIKGGVVLFGGDLSVTSQMRPCYPEFLTLSKSDGEKYIDCLADQIECGAAPEKKIVVAGHSTGAVHAEHLVQKIRDKSRVRLVLLEGYGSPANQRGVETACWYAKNGKNLGFNAGSMRNRDVCAGGAKSFEAPWCNSEFCLHFSLVNKSAPASLTRSTFGRHGYDDCEGNRAWLE